MPFRLRYALHDMAWVAVMTHPLHRCKGKLRYGEEDIVFAWEGAPAPQACVSIEGAHLESCVRIMMPNL